MPNTENINKVISAIREGVVYDGETVKFSMKAWYGRLFDSDLSACIGGMAECVMINEELRSPHLHASNDADLVVAGWLGLDNSSESVHLDYFKLFYPNDVSWDNITKEMAIQTLETLRDTGKIDWSHAPT